MRLLDRLQNIPPSPGLAIIKRELLSGLRNAKPFIFLAILLAVMIGVINFMIAEVISSVRRPGAAISGQDIRLLFMVFSYGLYASAVLLVPPMAGVSICSEKQQDSFDLLLMTYIRPRSLALAKLLNVLGIYALITVATLPIVGVFFFFVGVDWPQVLASAAIIAASALSCAVIGLLCSAWFYRTMTAIVATYIGVIFLHGGYLILAAILSNLLLVGTNAGRFLNLLFDTDVVVHLAPIVALFLIGNGFSSNIGVIGSVVYHTAIVIIGMHFVLKVLARPPRPMQVDAEKPIDNQEQLKARRQQFPYYLIDPRRRRPQIPDGKNAMLAKERQTGLLGRGTFTIRVFYSFTTVCLAISLFSIMANNYSSEDPGPFTAWPIVFDTILVLIVTPTFAATAIAKEYEWGNVDMLRMTMLSPGEIIKGKFLNACLTAALPVIGAMLGSMPGLYFTYRFAEGWAGLLSGYGSMAVCALYTLAITMLVTVTCKRTLTALMLGYAASILLLVIGPFTCLFIWEEMLRAGSDDSADVIFFSSPLLAQVHNLADYQMRSDNTLLTNGYWLANLAAFTALSAVALSLAKARFSSFLSRGTE